MSIPEDYEFQDEFVADNFIEANKSFYDRYILLRAKGRKRKDAFCEVFGLEHFHGEINFQNRIQKMELTKYYLENFENVLKAVSMDEVWNAKRSAHEMLEIVNNPYLKETARLAAIKELNVIFGITVIDESGKTKAGKTMAEFYASVAANPGA